MKNKIFIKKIADVSKNPKKEFFLVKSLSQEISKNSWNGPELILKV